MTIRGRKESHELQPSCGEKHRSESTVEVDLFTFPNARPPACVKNAECATRNVVDMRGFLKSDGLLCLAKTRTRWYGKVNEGTAEFEITVLSGLCVRPVVSSKQPRRHPGHTFTDADSFIFCTTTACHADCLEHATWLSLPSNHKVAVTRRCDERLGTLIRHPAQVLTRRQRKEAGRRQKGSYL